MGRVPSNAPFFLPLRSVKKLFFVVCLVVILWVSESAYERTGRMVYGWVTAVSLILLGSIAMG